LGEAGEGKKKTTCFLRGVKGHAWKKRVFFLQGRGELSDLAVVRGGSEKRPKKKREKKGQRANCPYGGWTFEGVHVLARRWLQTGFTKILAPSHEEGKSNALRRGHQKKKGKGTPGPKKRKDSPMSEEAMPSKIDTRGKDSPLRNDGMTRGKKKKASLPRFHWGKFCRRPRTGRKENDCLTKTNPQEWWPGECGAGERGGALLIGGNLHEIFVRKTAVSGAGK